MANYIEETGLSPDKYVNSASRYKSAKVVYYTEQKKLTFTTYKKNKINFAPSDQWYEIYKQVEYRPDLVSFEIYGTVDFWWKIMEVNGMKDILEFSAGRVIRLPGNVLF